VAEDKKTSLGPVGDVLRGNIKRIREAQRLTYVALSERLTELGRPIPVLGLRRIERGERRVDVDDLVALAVALATPPVDLMVPGDAADDATYGVTPEVSTTAAVAREWISGTDFLTKPESPADLAVAIQSMPKARAQALTRKWMAPQYTGTLEEQAHRVAAMDRISIEEARREVYRRAGMEGEGETE
jgi:transcriptional regulator with XRE-family HTH domain